MKCIGQAPKIQILPSVLSKIKLYGKLGKDKRKFYFIFGIIPSSPVLDFSSGLSYTISDATILEQSSTSYETQITKEQVNRYFGFTEFEYEDGTVGADSNPEKQIKRLMIWNGLGKTTGLSTALTEITLAEFNSFKKLHDGLPWWISMLVNADGQIVFQIVDENREIIWDDLKLDEVTQVSYEDVLGEYTNAITETTYQSGTYYNTSSHTSYVNTTTAPVQKRSPSELAQKNPKVDSLL